MAKPTEKPNPKISVFLSTEDHKAAKRAADEAEISLSKWIEALVKKALRTKKVAA